MRSKRFGDTNQRHAYYLEELIRNLHKVDENPKDISWVMHEGIWLRNGSGVYHSMPDLILGYADFNVHLLELKGSKNKRGKATQQLLSGAEFVTTHFPSYDIRAMKIVYYTKGNYTYEEISYDD